MPADNVHEASPKSRASGKNIKTPRRISETYLHNAGLAYLQRFAASSGRFQSVMRQKVLRSCRFHTDQNPEDCFKLVNELTEKFLRSGLLDDSAYARNSVASLRRRGISHNAIVEKLKTKGLSQEAIKAALANNMEEQDISAPQAELVAALILARRKKLGPFRKENDESADIKRELQKMASAGFSYDTARKALEATKNEAESLISDMRY